MLHLISLYDVNCRPIGRVRTDPVLTDLIGGNGGAYRDRTDDPLLAKQMLSQLS